MWTQTKGTMEELSSPDRLPERRPCCIRFAFFFFLLFFVVTPPIVVIIQTSVSKFVVRVL